MSDFTAFSVLEREGWGAESLATAYVDLFAPASDMALPALTAAVADCPHVLDLCCGQGNASERLLAAGHRVTGLDFSPAMLAHARARLPEAELIEGDAQALPFAEARFDGAVSGFGLVHVPDQPQALSEIARVLRPGGIFALTAWHGPEQSPAFGTLFGSIQAHGAPGVALPPGPDFHQFARPDSAGALLSAAGLEPLRRETLDCRMRLTDPGQLFEIFFNGAPRAGYLLRQQPPEALDAIRDAMGAAVTEKFADGEGWSVPIPAALVVARRP